jgi:hypothetical protein
MSPDLTPIKHQGSSRVGEERDTRQVFPNYVHLLKQIPTSPSYKLLEEMVK